MTTTTTATRVVISPGSLRQLGDQDGATFCLVASPSVLPYLAVDTSGGYADYMTVEVDDSYSFADALRERIPQRAHILAITPDRLFESPRREELGERKLLAMACNSTPTTRDTVAHFVDVLQRTDPAAQAAFADRFWALAEASDVLEIADDRYGTKAVFRHLERDCEWNQQAGPVGWGEQQLAPSGELSALPANIVEFDPDLRLALDGEIALRGLPILHSGAASFTRADQARIHADLATIERGAVVATVDDGYITAVRAADPEAEPAAEMLDALFRVDARYRIVWEIGFGINTELRPVPGNAAMNEVYGGDSGHVHFGVGLTPFTQYALIVVCTGSRVVGAGGEALVGGEALPGGRRNRLTVNRDGAGCGCRN